MRKDVILKTLLGDEVWGEKGLLIWKELRERGAIPQGMVARNYVFVNRY